MSFIADKQTLDDLNLMGKYRGNSIFSIFNRVLTAGGEQLLQNMFSHPLADIAAINKRSSIFRYFQHHAAELPFDNEPFSKMENYLQEGGSSSWWTACTVLFKKRIFGLAVKDDGYEIVADGIRATISVLHSFYGFISRLRNTDSPYYEEARSLQLIFDHPKLEWLKQGLPAGPLTFMQAVKYEYIFRQVMQAEMKVVLEAIHHLDVYIAVAETARSRGFSYARALPGDSHVFSAKEMWHPGLEHAVGNDISLDQHSNLLFLTGANMAGKSTFMKAFGIAVYLAHMGFPVAAKELSFSLRSGLYSSINVPDNLSLGLSHFYAEVLRVKKVAEEVASGSDLVVIFDELFKGTNVKDAYDATLAVSAAFSEYRNCLFIISTHIIEVGEALKEHDHIQFAYLPTIMEGNVPRYTYRLKEGITADRQGMLIIENEGILDLK